MVSRTGESEEFIKLCYFIESGSQVDKDPERASERTNERIPVDVSKRAGFDRRGIRAASIIVASIFRSSCARKKKFLHLSKNSGTICRQIKRMAFVRCILVDSEKQIGNRERTVS